MTNTDASSRFIPALSYTWLTAFYDPLVRWGMSERAFKQRLIKRANIQPRQRVLDVGCGTGTLALMIKRTVPTAWVIGIDADPAILDRARYKAQKASLSVRWDHGQAYALPYKDRYCDVIVSSLVVHHLTADEKLRCFREVRRVLTPHGAFHVLDFGRPFNALTRIQAGVMRGLEEVADNFAGLIPSLLREAGFTVVHEDQPFVSIFGPLWFYEARL